MGRDLLRQVAMCRSAERVDMPSRPVQAPTNFIAKYDVGCLQDFDSLEDRPRYPRYSDRV